MTTIKEKVLTPKQYEFYKRKGMTDAKVMELHGYNTVTLNVWKKENNLIGVKFEKDVQVESVTTIQAAKVSEETKPLREKEVVKASLAQTIEEYEANKKIQEKLKEKNAPVKENPAIGSLSVGEPSAMPVVKTTAEHTGNVQAIEMEKLKKMLASLEERHAADTETIGQLEKKVRESGKLSAYHELIRNVGESVRAERFRQNDLWGHQRHEHGKWLAILMEEVGEVAQAMQVGLGWGKATDAGDLYTELIHVSAVAHAFAEQVLEEQSK